MSDIKLAVEAFRSQYTRWPVTTDAIRAGKPDFTFGSWQVGEQDLPLVPNDGGKGYQANNSEVMYPLLGEEDRRYNRRNTVNPSKKIFINPGSSPQSSLTRGLNAEPGLGFDRVHRDPWGNPYIISLDVDEDGWTQDAFYSRAKVSAMFAKGVNGLHGLESRSGKGTNDYALHGTVMIWSFGPDGKADPNIRADEGVNQDNIVSWKW